MGDVIVTQAATDRAREVLLDHGVIIHPAGKSTAWNGNVHLGEGIVSAMLAFAEEARLAATPVQNRGEDDDQAELEKLLAEWRGSLANPSNWLAALRTILNMKVRNG